MRSSTISLFFAIFLLRFVVLLASTVTKYLDTQNFGIVFYVITYCQSSPCIHEFFSRYIISNFHIYSKKNEFGIQCYYH